MWGAPPSPACGAFLLLAVACPVGAVTNFNNEPWPTDIACPVLPNNACAEGDPLRAYLMLDFSNSVVLNSNAPDICPGDRPQNGNDLGSGWTDTVNFVETLFEELYCARYNINETDTELYVTTWSSQNRSPNPLGTPYDPDEIVRLEVGSGWDRIDDVLGELRETSPDYNPDDFVCTFNGAYNAGGGPGKKLGPGTEPTAALVNVKNLVNESSILGFRNVVVFLTDGAFGAGVTGNEDWKEGLNSAAIETANSIKNIPGAIFVAVGIGDAVVENVLTDMASEGLYLEAEDFAALEDVIDTLLQQLKCGESSGEVKLPPTFSPTPGPSRVPTSPTTGSPTVSPTTQAPSAKRTPAPTTTSPSYAPSASPSTYPTTSAPTRFPSTSIPTSFPSKAPVLPSSPPASSPAGSPSSPNSGGSTTSDSTPSTTTKARNGAVGRQDAARGGTMAILASTFLLFAGNW